jgi:carbonic anhydrase
MRLDRILEGNRAFVAGRERRPLPPAGTIGLVVVACYDPRLDTLLLPALGLEPGAAFLFRTAGALLRPSGDSLRSLAMAVYLFGAREVLVVGHTSCRMAAFQSSTFIESFRARGVPREAFGTEDLRAWAGAISDPRGGIRISAGSIRAAPFLPRDLSVAGLLLDDATGTLEVVVQPGEEPAAEPAAAREEPAPPGPDPAPLADGSKKPAAPPAKPPGEPPTHPDLAGAVTAFARSVQSKARWRAELLALRKDLGKPLSPIAKFQALESFAERAGAEFQDVRESFERLQRALLAGRSRLDPEDVIRLVRELSRRI